MVVKQMFFGEDILRKHLHFDDSMIVTGRFEKKGRIGDMFRLNNGETGFWALTAVSKRPMKVLEYAMKYWQVEGFNSWQELYETLSNLYGEQSEIYAHYLQLTSLEEGDIDA